MGVGMFFKKKTKIKEYDKDVTCGVNDYGPVIISELGSNQLRLDGIYAKLYTGDDAEKHIKITRAANSLRAIGNFWTIKKIDIEKVQLESGSFDVGLSVLFEGSDVPWFFGTKPLSYYLERSDNKVKDFYFISKMPYWIPWMYCAYPLGDVSHLEDFIINPKKKDRMKDHISLALKELGSEGVTVFEKKIIFNAKSDVNQIFQKLIKEHKGHIVEDGDFPVILKKRPKIEKAA